MIRSKKEKIKRFQRQKYYACGLYFINDFKFEIFLKMSSIFDLFILLCIYLYSILIYTLVFTELL